MIPYHSDTESKIMKLLEKIREFLRNSPNILKKDLLLIIINISYKNRYFALIFIEK